MFDKKKSFEAVVRRVVEEYLTDARRWIVENLEDDVKENKETLKKLVDYIGLEKEEFATLKDTFSLVGTNIPTGGLCYYKEAVKDWKFVKKSKK